MKFTRNSEKPKNNASSNPSGYPKRPIVDRKLPPKQTRAMSRITRL
jgi:hypothetical protein